MARLPAIGDKNLASGQYNFARRMVKTASIRGLVSSPAPEYGYETPSWATITNPPINLDRGNFSKKETAVITFDTFLVVVASFVMGLIFGRAWQFFASLPRPVKTLRRPQDHEFKPRPEDGVFSFDARDRLTERNFPRQKRNRFGETLDEEVERRR